MGELAPLRTAESMAASRRTVGTRARARSMIVRVADVQRNPLATTRSRRGSDRVVWTRRPAWRPRPLRQIENSTSFGRHRSNWCSRAAASWLTTGSSPRQSRPTINRRSIDCGLPASTNTRGASERSQPRARRVRTCDGVTPSSASWHDVIAPCWAAARLVMAVTVARSTPTVGVLNSVERNLRHLGQAIRDMTADSLTKAGSRGW